MGHEQLPSSCFAPKSDSIGSNFSQSPDVDTQMSCRSCIHTINLSCICCGVDLYGVTCRKEQEEEEEGKEEDRACVWGERQDTVLVVVVVE